MESTEEPSAPVPRPPPFPPAPRRESPPVPATRSVLFTFSGSRSPAGVSNAVSSVIATLPAITNPWAPGTVPSPSVRSNGAKSAPESAGAKAWAEPELTKLAGVVKMSSPPNSIYRKLQPAGSGSSPSRAISVVAASPSKSPVAIAKNSGPPLPKRVFSLPTKPTPSTHSSWLSDVPSNWNVVSAPVSLRAAISQEPS